ncbi:MAG: hypothetical protein OXH20_00465 [bacterium]|nr:hypothetical protein [bacterium]MDE0669745.1 hypothetical protein [bacterium]MXZ31485.1 hypothetical protein [Acidimicrobiia bacterium]MYB24436.1 hypothetical protein [Acidimicrobiia bacterium]MYJ14365.1 hypothetical protein [Acidimicrobiia bacterium]
MECTAVIAAPPEAHGAATGPTAAVRQQPRRVYLWRRAVVLAALTCLLWGALWGVFQLGSVVGARLVAPALGTAPVPAADGAQADS